MIFGIEIYWKDLSFHSHEYVKCLAYKSELLKKDRQKWTNAIFIAVLQ